MARDDQLIENLRARTWPGDCEAAAFRIEELLARVAELEANQLGVSDLANKAWADGKNEGLGDATAEASVVIGELLARVAELEAGPAPRDGHARQQDADAIIGLRSCNSLHGSDRTGTGMLGCLYRMRVTDPGCTGCVDRDEDQSAEAGG